MDELEAQLRRYADAAETRVPSTPSSRNESATRRSRRSLLAVAAALAIVASSIGVLVLRDTDQQLNSVPAEAPPTAGAACPEPADNPNAEDVQLALPWPASVERVPNARTDPGVFRQLIRPGEQDSIEIEIHWQQRPLLVEGSASPHEITLCDPHSGDAPARTTASASLSLSPTGRRVLTVPLTKWTLVLTTGPAHTSDVTVEELLEIAAGMTWPATAGERPVTTVHDTAPAADCPTEPDTAIEMGSLTVTALPAGYEPKLPVEVEDSGVPVDMGGESRASLTLLHPRDGAIQITSFASPNPAAYVEEQVAVADVDHVNVRLCRDPGNPERSDHLVTLGRNGGTMAAASQIWEYEGFLVTGPITSREVILEVVEGLRF